MLSLAVMAVVGLLWAPPVFAANTVFRFIPPEDLDITSVSVRGEFNSWGETALTLQDDGTWSISVELEPGRYLYKYFINGDWPKDMSDWNGVPADPDADEYADDNFGGKNAVRLVGDGESAVESGGAGGVSLYPARMRRMRR